ncbi:Helix-turn-helix domain-containing protein [Clostridium amylolyticum]|uniref:Helix-turn-helix domain-containing protein n=1 Tax=Clostridium amylolyticum TaxID=1121298 RepID=A0A1M6I385_9CLOT|nr:helix-turn-helix transcriptional regulator [Clostridium amylolyticum]SHJ28937.1 Helix-turn-helix domain-containing protein [Clostridium amylolyticum]
MNFGEKLQFLRKSKGMSQEHLASQITVSRQAISKWELGESMPDTDNVIQLSNFFEVSIDYLLKDDIKSDTSIPTVKENSTLIKMNNRDKRLLVSGIVLSGIGVFGNLFLLVLSRTKKVPVVKSRIMPDGTKMYYGGSDVLDYSFWPFISQYKLQVFFWMFLILFALGIALFLIRIMKHGEKVKER